MHKSRDICSICAKCCDGNVIKFKQNIYHPDCFKCEKCAKLLQYSRFFCIDNRYFCFDDYLETYGERCYTCRKYIKNEYIKTHDRICHRECFVCDHCKMAPIEDTVIQNGDQIVCLKCHSSLQNGCTNCCKKIDDFPVIMIFENRWHSSCFQCDICKKQLTLENYSFFNGKLYCNPDFHKYIAFNCHQCRKLINTDFLEVENGDVLGEKPLRYHKECIKCCKCSQAIVAGDKVIYDRPNLYHVECTSAQNDSGMTSLTSSQMSELQFSVTSNSTNSGFNCTGTIPKKVQFQLPNNQVTKQYSYLNNQQYLQRPLGPKSPNPKHYHIPPKPKPKAPSPPPQSIARANIESENFEDFRAFFRRNTGYLTDLQKLAIVANHWSNHCRRQKTATVDSVDNRGRCVDNSTVPAAPETDNDRDDNNNDDDDDDDNGETTKATEKNRRNWWSIFRKFLRFKK